MLGRKCPEFAVYMLAAAREPHPVQLVWVNSSMHQELQFFRKSFIPRARSDHMP